MFKNVISSKMIQTIYRDNYITTEDCFISTESLLHIMQSLHDSLSQHMVVLDKAPAFITTSELVFFLIKE